MQTRCWRLIGSRIRIVCRMNIQQSRFKITSHWYKRIYFRLTQLKMISQHIAITIIADFAVLQSTARVIRGEKRVIITIRLYQNQSSAMLIRKNWRKQYWLLVNHFSVFIFIELWITLIKNMIIEVFPCDN